MGDSMTFFYRRLPPFARRKSGVRVSMDTLKAKDSLDGDASHNRCSLLPFRLLVLGFGPSVGQYRARGEKEE